MRQPQGTEPTMADLISLCMEDVRQTCRAPRSYAVHARMFADLWGHRPATDVTRADVLGWAAARRRDRKPATVAHELAFLSRCFRVARDVELLDYTPVHGLRLAPVRNHRDRILSPVEETRLLSQLDRESQSIVRAYLVTGMRRGELFALQASDVDNTTGFLHLRAEDCKSGRGRSIPIHPTIAEDMAARSSGSGYLWRRSHPGKDRVNVATWWYVSRFRPACEAAGINGITLHNLRHTFASRLIMAGADLVVVRDLLGHHDIKQTMRYLHLAPSYLTQAVRLLAN